MTTKYVATVGINIGSKRIEAGERVEGADDKQLAYLKREKYVIPVSEKQRIPAETKKAIEGGILDPHPVDTEGKAG